MFEEPRESLLGAVEQSTLQVVLPQFRERLRPFTRRQVGAIQQVGMDTHRAVEFAAPAKQVAQRMMQFDGLGIQLDDLDERIDRLIVLVVEQQVEPAEVRARQCSVIRGPRPRFETATEPAGREHQRQDNEIPELELHQRTSGWAATSTTAPDCRAAAAIRSSADSTGTPANPSRRS